MSPPDLIERVVSIAREAGDLILAFHGKAIDVRSKCDASPVTHADEAAGKLIVSALARLTPDVPVVCEELRDSSAAPGIGSRFWLVDPLDGTKEFVSGSAEFTVNIALVEQRRSVLGVVLAPALGRLFAGVAHGGAFAEEHNRRRAIRCRNVPPEGLTVVSSRSHRDADAIDAFLASRRVAASSSAGSSLKFCMVASGEADLYPRLGRTMEWDTAAGHALLAAAGGRVTQLDGQELIYGKPEFANPHFVAMGLPA
jgi:3'(2'), 5'-bisphosphate nucleotidase